MKMSIFFIIGISVLLLMNFNACSQELVDITRTEAIGITSEHSVMRRDPSDIIKVADTYYIWYSKRLLEDGINLFPGDPNAENGYSAEVWYATSTDGKKWYEKGVCVKKGDIGEWDEQSVFTPNILVWKGKYYLYYTGVPKPFTNLGNKVTKSAIGLAVSDSPLGPWKKMKDPVLLCSEDIKLFDSMRVDDACLVVLDGKIYLYYKGRKWDDTPGNTKMGVAISDNPEGKFIKHSLNPLIPAGHEVMVWPLEEGIVALINIGPKDIQRTLQYSPDGIHFSTMQQIEKVPNAAGFFRPEAFTDSKKGEMPNWGIEIVKKPGNLPGLGRFDMKWAYKKKNP